MFSVVAVLDRQVLTDTCLQKSQPTDLLKNGSFSRLRKRTPYPLRPHYLVEIERPLPATEVIAR